MDLQKRNENLKAFFDRKTDGYDDVHIRFMESKCALTDALPDGTAHVLDLGAGTGLELIPLYERFPEVFVTAVDLSEDMLAVLRTRPFADRVTTVSGDFFEVPFRGEDGTAPLYDAMISTSALHHFTPEDKVRLYRRVYSVLRPGGLFLNADKTASDPAAQAEGFRVLAEEPEKYAHIDTPLTVGAECTALEEAGFTVLSVTPLANDNYYLYKAIKKESSHD